MAGKGDARKAAWDRYRSDCLAAQNTNGVDYEEIEPAIWAKLQAELDQIPQPKKKKVLAHA